MLDFLIFLYHLIICGAFIFALFFRCFIMRVPTELQHLLANGIKCLSYLTLWNLIVQISYYLACIIEDCGKLQGISTNLTHVTEVKDFIFASLAFPMSMIVCFTFWGFYTYDREIIHPRSFDGIYPVWLNHICHTAIFLCMVGELITSHHTYPKRGAGIFGTLAFILIYHIWSFLYYFVTGQWLYEFSALMNWPQRFLFILLQSAVMVFIYLGAESLNSLIWGK